MKALLEQFQYLDTSDPGTWPAAPKAMLLLGLLAGILVLAYFLDWQGQLEELDTGKQQEVQLKQDYVNKKRQAVNIELYRQQLREIDSSFGALLKQLPNKSQMEALIVDINQAGLGRGLQFELFKPAPQENVKEFYAELPITVKVTGQYHDMGAFASDVSQLSRIVTLNNLVLAVDKTGGLKLDAIAKTFRYLDDEELAAQRKPAKTKKKAAKK
ncbi:MAG TPA: type 4a pilus biogenesis protein PilO [Burkholderiales bacterium]